MMQAVINRQAPTRGSMTFSTGVHVALLLLLMYGLKNSLAHVDTREDLTQISYVEARYGEDVASKVRLKTKPEAEPGPGVSTRSAVKPQSPSPAPARAESLEDVAAPAPALTPKPVELAQAPQLEARTPRASSRPIIDTDALKTQITPGTAQEVEALSRELKRPRASFQPVDAGLVDRGKTLESIDPTLPTGSGGDRTAGRLAESNGPTLESRRPSQGSASYQPPSGGLASSRSSRGSLEEGTATGVSGGRGSSTERSGRRTILDYGTGGGGGLSGRGGGLAEAPKPIAPPVTESSPADKGIAEAKHQKINGKGVGMTITGQIQGRKILKSVPPVYTAQARQNGWEGVVAVHFTVLPDGRVKDNMYFTQTSNHRDLNKAATDAIKQFRFAALGADQSAVEQWGVITIVFRLH